MTSVAIPLERLEGKYEILEKLQEGGMGAIYKVRHRLLGEVRVVKVMRPHLQGEPDLRDRFLAEARAATRLSHPHLARIFDCSLDEDGNAYIVMEYIPGLTLAELLAQAEPVPLPLVLEIARQGLRALGHLHQHQVAHRDVSPDNLMLTRDVDGRPLVKLIDLGIAKAIEDDGPLTGAGVFLGKFRYAPPETFEEPKPEDRRPGDLYSFALVLYELLTGVFPISGDSPSSLIAGHLFRPPLEFAESDPHGRIPEGVRQAVLTALAKSPGGRFADAESFCQALPAGGETDLSSPEVHRVLKLTEAPERAPAPQSAGSTQARLDSSFRVEPTPAPGPIAVPPGEAPEDPDETMLLPAAPVGRPSGEGETIRIVPAAPRIRELLAQAQRASRGGDDSGALASLEKALAIDPDDAEVRALHAETRRAVRRRRAEERREQAITTRVGKISGLLQADRLDEADADLTEAGESFGRDPRWSTLRARLETRRMELDQARTLRVEDFVTRARGLAQTEDFEQAAALLRSALHLIPDHPQAKALLASVEACREVHEQETRETAEVERTVTGIRQALDEGRPADALEDLNRAAHRFGDHEDLHELRYEAAQAQLQPTADSENTTLLRSTPAAAENAVDEGLDLDKTLGSIRALCDEGRAGEALKELNLALQEYGPQPELKTLRYKLGEALLERDAEEEETASRMFEAFEEPQQPPQPQPADPGAAAAAGNAAAAPEPADRGLHDATIRSASAVQPPPERPAPPVAQSHRGMLAVALVLAAVFALLVWILTRDGNLPDITDLRTEDVAARDLSPGSVAIDAVPWAEIVDLEQPGAEEAPPIPPSRFTPVILPLLPGDYVITLRYPPTGEERELTVRVETDARVDQRVVFPLDTASPVGAPLDGAEYFQRIGW